MTNSTKWILFIALLSAIAIASAGETRPQMLASNVKTAITVDGKLDEDVWQHAPVYNTFTPLNKVGSVRRKTDVRMLYTPQGIVVGFHCYMPPDEIVAEPGPLDHMNSYRGESVEFMVDSAATADTYHHFVLNAANCAYDACRLQGGYIETAHWTSGFLHAVGRTNDGWTAEMMIPYRVLDFGNGVNRSFWKVNFARHSLIEGTDQDYSVATPQGTIHTSLDFITVNAPEILFDDYMLTLRKPEFSGKSAGEGFAGNITSKITNHSDLVQRLKVSASIRMPDGAIKLSASELELPSKGEQELSLELPLLEKGGDGIGTLLFRNATTNRIVILAEFPCQVKYVPLTIKIIDPHYRNAIFASQKLDKVRFIVDADTSSGTDQLRAGVKLPGTNGKILCSQNINPGKAQQFDFPAEPLPEGNLEIFAELLDKNGKNIAMVTEDIRKLPYLEGEVFIGKDDLIYRDGKPVFILASWADDYTSPDYNLNIVKDTPAEMIFCDITGIDGYRELYQELKRTQTVRAETIERFREIARQNRDDPRVFAYFIMDEPYYCITTKCAETLTVPLKEEDPWHPSCFGCSPTYWPAAEIFATHPYPSCRIGQPFSNFQMFVARMEDNFRNCYRKPGQYADLFMHQGFNYGDCGRRDERIPSYEEFRSQNFLMLILGCQGVFFYNRTTPHYPELYIGMPHLRKELLVVGNHLCIQSHAEQEPCASNANFKLMGRKNRVDGSYWLMVCNASYETVEAEIEFAPVKNQPMQVLSENRMVTLQQGRFVDRFTPWEVHIYTTNMADFKLTPRTVITAAIEEVYAKRAKPGNLAYQRFEDETVNVTASSNFFYDDRAENILWHLADGVCEGDALLRRSFMDGILVYKDTTPNEVPDWFQFQFKKPIKAGRVVIYPVSDSVTDYRIEVMKNGKLETVAEAHNVSGLRSEVSFEPVETDIVRCTVTGNRGEHTIVYEMEVYSK